MHKWHTSSKSQIDIKVLKGHLIVIDFNFIHSPLIVINFASTNFPDLQ